jgi:hypothetical protein
MKQISSNMAICPHCGRTLSLDNFYKRSDRGYETLCKDCFRQENRKRYPLKPEGCYIRPDGRIFLNKGGIHSIYWSNSMIKDLKEKFHNTSNEDLLIEFGLGRVSLRTLIRKARELGLKKDHAYLHYIYSHHLCNSNIFK